MVCLLGLVVVNLAGEPSFLVLGEEFFSLSGEETLPVVCLLSGYITDLIFFSWII